MTVVLVVGVRDASCLGCLPSLDSVLESAREREREEMAGKERQVSALIRLVVNAGQAKPAPPVGPALGQHRLNLMAFCKDFNARTQHIKSDVPMSVMVTAYKDNSFDFVVKSPSASYFLKKAAGLQSGGGNAGHKVAGTVTPKHIYEIAKIKQSDPDCQYMSLEAISKSIMGTAQSMGIQVKHELV
jgi:large subunit ribosomal protein L11